MTVFVLEWIIMEETRDDKCDRILKTTYSNIRAKLNVNKLFVLILKFYFYSKFGREGKRHRETTKKKNYYLVVGNCHEQMTFVKHPLK